MLLALVQGQAARADIQSATVTVAAHYLLFHAIKCPAGSTQPLKKAPAWLKRPAGVAFGFGNRLVSFSNTMQQGQDGQMVGAGTITIQQVGILLSSALLTCLPRGRRRGVRLGAEEGYS